MRCSRLKNIVLASLLSALPCITFAEEIGSVDTVFKIFGTLTIKLSWKHLMTLMLITLPVI